MFRAGPHLTLIAPATTYLAVRPYFAPYEDPCNLPYSSNVHSHRTLTVRSSHLRQGAPGLNKYSLIWLGCGTDDSLYPSNKAIADWMDRNDVRHTFRSIPGAHVWPVWHKFLAEVAPQLFTHPPTRRRATSAE